MSASNVTPDDIVGTASSTSNPTNMPATSDMANSEHDGDQNTGGLYSYYFIFIALILAAVGFAAWLTYKRKKKYGMLMQSTRESALQRDLNSWDAARARRRYWHGRWRSTEISHEEGLNENGEAPPPYVPKPRDEEEGRAHATNGQPSVPMQTLSREQAGLKPPDYSEVGVRPASEGAPSPAGAASSPQRHDASENTR